MPHTQGMTQHEVAKELGISQGRVLQLEQAAFRKLRTNPDAVRLLEWVRFIPKPSAARKAAGS